MSWLFGTCQQCLMSLWFLPLWVIIFFWVSRRICYFSQRLDHSYLRMSDDLHFICQSKSQDHLRSKGRQVDCMMCMKRKWGCWLTSLNTVSQMKKKKQPTVELNSWVETGGRDPRLISKKNQHTFRILLKSSFFLKLWQLLLHLLQLQQKSVVFKVQILFFILDRITYDYC